MVVIGAGALGLSTALHCALAGRSVAVVERHTAGSQASGRAAGLFKSVQADELRTALARRSIIRAMTFADWAGAPLKTVRPGSFLIARTDQHRQFLCRELDQSRGWGADVREATPAELAERLTYYRPVGDYFAVSCPEDIYIEDPASLIQAYLAACQRHGAVVIENEPVIGIPVTAGRVTGVETERRSIAAPVVVAVAVNVSKQPLFTWEERVALIRETVQLPSVEVRSFEGLLVDFAKQVGATMLIRGLRAVSDFEYEFQMALMNRTLAPTLETVFLVPAFDLTYLSSSLVREVARFGGDVSALVDPVVQKALKKKFKSLSGS